MFRLVGSAKVIAEACCSCNNRRIMPIPTSAIVSPVAFMADEYVCMPVGRKSKKQSLN
jgi:hypothetical protein